MGDLFWNKIFACLLAVVLGVMALQQLSSMVFSSGHGGGHHGEEEGTLNDWAHSRFAYYTDIAETAGAGGEAEEEVYDLGALLANADVSSGERAFKSKCSTCHTIAEGGGNGTGPNLHGIITAEHAHKDNFGYSSAMMATAGKEWTYETIDQWLENPSSYIRGTSMAFAGLRRDDERADVIAYLASNTPNAPDFPEPLPEEEPEGEAAEGEEGGDAEATEAEANEGEAGESEATEASGEDTSGEAVETTLDAETVEDAPSEATGQIETVDSVDGGDNDDVEGDTGEVEMAPDAAVEEDDQ